MNRHDERAVEQALGDYLDVVDRFVDTVDEDEVEQRWRKVLDAITGLSQSPTVSPAARSALARSVPPAK